MRPRLVGAFVVFLVVVAASAQAQAPRENVDTEVINKIKEEGHKRSQVMDTISYLTDVHGPRLTASPRTRAAAEWTKERLTKWGLENAHLEPWGPFGRGWSLEGFTANMLEPTYSPLIAFPKAWSPSTPKTIRGEPVFLDVAKEEDLEHYRGKLRRAIVLLSPPRELKALFDPPGRRYSDGSLLELANNSPSSGDGTRGSPIGRTSQQRAAEALLEHKWQFIYDEGAAIVLEPSGIRRQPRVEGGTVFVSSATMPPRAASSDDSPQRVAGATPDSAPDDNRLGDSSSRRGPRPWNKDAPEIVPQVVLAVEHYNRIVRMLQKKTPVQLEIDIASRYHADDLMSYNIVAEIPGGDLKDELVMLGGHFDSWHSGTGATDNAVGCGVALEAVRILQSLGIKPRRTIRIALWTGEEQGLLGSKAYVADHFGRAINPPQSGSRGGRGGRDGQSANGDARSTAQSTHPTKYELKAGHEKFSAYFNLDNGTGKVRGVYMQGNEAVRPIFRAWLAPFADLGALTLSPSNTSGTDHLSFDAVGLPGFQFIQDPLEYDSRTHHSNMDVYDRVQEDDMKQASIIMASFVYHAAMRDEKLPRKPLVGEVTPSTPAPERATSADSSGP